MKNSDFIHKTLGLIFIIFGIIFYLTPIPGTTTLIVLGFIWLIGEKRTLEFFRKVLNDKVFKFLKLESLLERKY